MAVRQHHFLADELREFFRADFAQPRTGVAPVSNFKFRKQRVKAGGSDGDRRAALSYAAHAEQRRLQHMHVAVVDELLEEAEEIRDHQIADVQAVHVRVGGNLDLYFTELALSDDRTGHCNCRGCSQ